ncbi:MAG TPA: hypothetical protein VMA32_14945 [Streptosporangiaceae bacterium]|nr:hypothetical protein [Streptosporangiaceae bacterium]
MSGPGDIDPHVSGDEAAWRDLIARFDAPADPDAADPPWPSSEDLTQPIAEGDLANPEPAADPGITRNLSGGADGYLPTDRTRIIRFAGEPRSYSPPDEEDEPYVAAPLPPPAKLDAVAKAAWVGVIGGPGYLLVVSLFLHMAVSATAAFIAVAAFVGGFATLIVKLGDRPPRDDDDDGAVL